MRGKAKRDLHVGDFGKRRRDARLMGHGKSTNLILEMIADAWDLYRRQVITMLAPNTDREAWR